MQQHDGTRVPHSSSPSSQQRDLHSDISISKPLCMQSECVLANIKHARRFPGEEETLGNELGAIFACNEVVRGDTLW